VFDVPYLSPGPTLNLGDDSMTLDYEIEFDFDEDTVLLDNYINDGSDASIAIDCSNFTAEKRQEVAEIIRDFLKPVTNGKRTLSKMLDPESQNRFDKFLTAYDLND
jgi:hypothetical protein